MNNSSKLKTKDKILIFFFGAVIVLFGGAKLFSDFSGTGKKKKQTMTLYYAGLVFWLLIAIAVYFAYEASKVKA